MWRCGSLNTVPWNDIDFQNLAVLQQLLQNGEVRVNKTYPSPSELYFF